jgi:hypothetical protein
MHIVNALYHIVAHPVFHIPAIWQLLPGLRLLGL